MNAVVSASSRSSGEFMATDFTKSVEVLETVGSAQDRDWLLLWFSELAVLALMIASLGSALWYFLQLHVLGVSCNKALAFFGTIFRAGQCFVCDFHFHVHAHSGGRQLVAADAKIHEAHYHYAAVPLLFCFLFSSHGSCSCISCPGPIRS